MITTPEQLATRLGIPIETQAIAAQTTGLIPYLRAFIADYGETVVLGRHEGKVERVSDAFERVTGKALHPKKKRA